MSNTVGILHPGSMGSNVAQGAVHGRCKVVWASAGRSAKTKERADSLGLVDVGSVADMCRESDAIVSVCPPHAAEQVAELVASLGFTGLYIDANAISPDKASREAEMIEKAGGSFCDGSIIGGVYWIPDIRLYLSGQRAKEAASWFADPIVPRVVGAEIGKASALKMAYEAAGKGGGALLVATLSLADQLGVLDELLGQWDHETKGRGADSVKRLSGIVPRAWRFVGEMNEIADTLDSAGLPNGFGSASSELYQRLAGFKDVEDMPDLDDVLGKTRVD